VPDSPEPIDPAVVAALRDAIAANPDALGVRLHLAALLLRSGEAVAALEQYTAVLAREPANPAALAGAAQAAAAAGARAPEAAPDPGAGGHQQPATVLAEAGAGGSPWWEAIFTRVTLADVGGMEAVKRRLDVSFLAPMRNPALREAYGHTLRGGLLLYGPPGCGKTYIARALAGELKARFISVGLDEVLDMHLGQSEKHIAELFGYARRNAPCVIFFDELDALGQKRIQLRNSPAQRGIVNQLLAELDGVQSENEGVFVLAATNHPWDVDSALLRPGRFDRSILVVPPDREARREILQHQLRGRPALDLDLDWLADHTDGFSGADLAQLVKTASEAALERAVATGVIGPIGMEQMKTALRETRPSVSTWFETARNVVIFANQSGMYDELADYMKARKAL
jgi:SpoVK/Ycf46/Vps4 family AAA+-type ATPase